MAGLRAPPYGLTVACEQARTFNVAANRASHQVDCLHTDFCNNLVLGNIVRKLSIAVFSCISLPVFTAVSASLFLNPTAMAHHRGQDGTAVLKGEVTAPVKEIPVKYDEISVDNGGCLSGAVSFLFARDATGVKDAVVYIKGIQRGKAHTRFAGEETPFVIDQKDYVFVPHVTVVPLGSAVEIKNSDPEVHNLHSFSTKNASFNEGIAAAGGPIQKRFDFVEAVRIGCDIHKEMAAWIVVRDNPYYCVTGENGRFNIEGIPPGSYKLAVWHEDFDREELLALSTEVNVEPGNELVVDFYLSHKRLGP